jgi:hypothetical protein
LVFIDDYPPIHFRELCPKDFYFAQILRNKGEGSLALMERVTLNFDDLLDLPSLKMQRVVRWVSEDLFHEKIMTVENWLRTSYHLCKQRWDSSVDWLESQPVSKVFLMIDIVKEHHEEVEDQMKKASRK